MRASSFPSSIVTQNTEISLLRLMDTMPFGFRQRSPNRPLSLTEEYRQFGVSPCNGGAWQVGLA